MFYPPQPVQEQREYKEIPTEMTYIDYVPVEKKVTHIQPMEEITGYIPVVQQEPVFNYVPVQGFQERVFMQPVKNTVRLPFQRFVPSEIYQSQLLGQQQPQANYEQPASNENVQNSNIPINQTNHIGRGQISNDRRRHNDYDTLH